MGTRRDLTKARASKRFRALAVTVIALAPILMYEAAAHASGPTSGATYVALGDSYAAGEGLGGFETGTNVPVQGAPNTNPSKNLCHRSASDAYGSIQQAQYRVLPNVPAAQRAFWACSGARSSDMMQSQGALAVSDPYYQSGQPAQVQTVGASTRYISVSAGGNDVGFGDLGKACAVYTTGSTASPIPGLNMPSCSSMVATAVSKLPALKQHLEALYKSLLDAAPQAVVAAVGYPRVFPAAYTNVYTTLDHTQICLTNVPYRDSQITIGVGLTVQDAQSVDQQVIQGLNNTTRAAISDLNSDPAYAGRLAYADSYNSPKDVPQNCTGVTPNVTVNGVVLSLAGHGIEPSDKWPST